VNRIPLVDLAAQHEAVAAEVAEGWQELLGKTAFIGGPQVAAFEREYAEFSGVRHCVGVANGTDAIEVALRALGIGTGDECILPANSFVATAEAVSRAGATPVLVDCADDDTYLLDTRAVEAAVTPRTRAIIPVHLYGQAAPAEQLAPVAERFGGWVVADAAQAQGAGRNGRSAAVLSHAAATSFYPGKNLGAYGDAGAVVTDSDELAGRMRMIADHGTRRKYEHEVFGFNSRLDTLQAGWNAGRRAAADRYHDLLAGVDEVVRPRTLAGNEHVWHLYVVRVPGRDRVLKELQTAGIGAGIHYPVPIHLAPAFAGLGYAEGSFPVAERHADQLLSLPTFAEITPEQQQRVVATLKAALR
jgi:dTDP-4-amino-4,6-dideoxygalactose transaminase